MVGEKSDRGTATADEAFKSYAGSFIRIIGRNYTTCGYTPLLDHLFQLPQSDPISTSCGNLEIDAFGGKPSLTKSQWFSLGAANVTPSLESGSQVEWLIRPQTVGDTGDQGARCVSSHQQSL